MMKFPLSLAILTSNKISPKRSHATSSLFKPANNYSLSSYKDISQ